MKLKVLFEKLLQEKENSIFKTNLKFESYKKLLFDEAKKKLTIEDRVYLARYQNRPKARDFIEYLVKDPIYFHGDRKYGEDQAIIGGLGVFAGENVTFLGIEKGSNLESNIESNFGMPHPEGYRKAQRLAAQAEKFRRPVICFIDTPGAYPGVEAEERGQAEAIATSIYQMCGLKTSIISVITGEGCSGGALALGVCDRLLMMENAIYSILSPEGYASILWKDSLLSGEAMELMKLSARELKEFKICDVIIEEELALGKEDFEENFKNLKVVLADALREVEKIPEDIRLKQRREKFGRLLWD